MEEREVTGLYRREAVDHHSRLDRRDTMPSFDPGSLMPRWRSVLIGAVLLVLLGVAGLAYTVPQGPRGMIADVADGSVIVAFADPPSLTSGDAVVLAFGDGTEVEGVAAETETASGSGITATMLLVELDSFGSATGRENQNVTVNPTRTGLLYDIFDGGGTELT